MALWSARVSSFNLAVYIGFEPIYIYRDRVASTPSRLINHNRNTYKAVVSRTVRGDVYVCTSIMVLTRGLEPRRTAFQAAALPDELSERIGDFYRDRTYDLRRVKALLYR